MQSKHFDTKYKAKCGDIVICSYPRTGTTWLRAMVAHMFIGAEATPKEVCDRKNMAGEQWPKAHGHATTASHVVFSRLCSSLSVE